MSSRFARVALASALVIAALSASAQTVATRSAKLDQALEAIVPTPYAIELDRRVPRDWVVHWTPGAGNWMKVLQEALEPMGLKVEADWARSVIRVRPAEATLTTPPSQGGSRLKAVGAKPVDWPALVTVSSSGWDADAPKLPSQPMSVGRALAAVVPAEFTNLEVEYSGVSATEKVIWNGKTRRDALLSIEKALGAKILLTPHGLLVVPDGVVRTSAQTLSSVQSMPTPELVKTSEPNAEAFAKATPGPSQDPKIVATPVPMVQDWKISEGQVISAALKDWAKKAGWSVVWGLRDDWTAPNATSFSGDFVDAASSAIKALADNGADIHGTFYKANKTLVVSPRGSHE